MNRVALVLGLLGLAACETAVASDLYQDDWSFNFFNDSREVVVEFSTVNPNGRWSQNWLDGPLMPGTGLTLSFYDPNDTRCEVTTRVVFGDGSSFEPVVNYCGTATVHVTDTEMYWQ